MRKYKMTRPPFRELQEKFFEVLEERNVQIEDDAELVACLKIYKEYRTLVNGKTILPCPEDLYKYGKFRNDPIGFFVPSKKKKPVKKVVAKKKLAKKVDEVEGLKEELEFTKEMLVVAQQEIERKDKQLSKLKSLSWL